MLSGMRARPLYCRVISGKTILFGLTAWLVASHLALAADPEPGAAPWSIRIMPYYWAPDIDSTLTLGGEALDLDHTFLDPAGHFKPNVGGMAFMVEREHLSFGVVAQSLYSDLRGLSGSGGLSRYEYQNHTATAVAGTYWQWGAADGMHLSLAPWLGGRYRRVTHRLIGEGDEVLAGWSRDAFVPALGMQAQLGLTPAFSVALAVDGDRGASDQYTFSTTGWTKFHLRHELSLLLGYRHEEFQRHGTQGGEPWRSEGRSHGAMIGLEVAFRGELTPANKVWDGSLHVTTDGKGRTVDDDLAIARARPPDDASRWAFLRWLDSTHLMLNDRLDRGVAYTDTLIGREFLTEGVTKRRTRLETGFYSKVSEDDGIEFELKPEFRFSAEFPNLEKYARLVVNSRAVSDAPGGDKFDEDRGLSVGIVSRKSLVKRVKFRAGIRTSSGPYVSALIRPRWRRRDWYVEPALSGYYRADRGAGSYASLLVMNWLRDRYRAHYNATIEISEHDPDFVWRHNLALSYLFEGDEADRHRSLVSRFAFDGRGTSGATRYTWTPLYYRAPLYRKWIYYEVGPEVSWKQEERWEPIPAIRVAILGYFWGTVER